jgi:tRNA (guanine-N7-)-methyltransferase
MLQGCTPPDEAFPDWAEDYGRRAPNEVEIGPGRGAFALDHAALHPSRDLVLIETRRSDCELIRHRASRRGLSNLRVFQGDAKVLLPRWFRAGELAAVHVQFPDPWWKKRHHKRRLVDVELAQLFRKLLVKDGLVDFRTDVEGYFREACQTWLDAGFVPLADALVEVLSTRERRYKETGQPVFRAAYRNPVAEIVGTPTDRTGRDWLDVRRK